MKKKIIPGTRMFWVTLLALLFFFGNTFVMADKVRIEELKQELEKAPGFEKSRLLNELAKLYFGDRDNQKKIIEYGEKAMQAAREFKNEEQEIYALVNIGFGYWKTDNDEKGMEFANKGIKLARGRDKRGMLYALKLKSTIYAYNAEHEKSFKIDKRMLTIYKEIGDKKGIAKCTHWVGSSYYALGEISKAYEYYKKALTLYRNVGNKEMTAQMLTYLGSFNSRYGNDEKAMEYFLKSAEIAEKEGFESMRCRVYEAIGKFYKKRKNYIKSFEYYEKALKISEKINSTFWLVTIYYSLGDLNYLEKKYDKALEYFEQAMKYQLQMNDTGGNGGADILIRIGHVYVEKKDYGKALGNYQKALEIAVKFKEYENETESYKGMGEIYMAKGDFKKALYYFDKSLKIAKKLKRNQLIQEIYKSMSDLDEKLGRYKEAIKYLRLYSDMKDKTFSEDSAKKIADMQIKYETEKKEKEIEALKKDNRIQQLTLEQQRLIRNASIIAALLGLIILIMFLKKYRYLLTFWKKKNYVGHYRLVDKIASGGMGIIYKAQDMLDKTRILAIKVLREEYFEDEVQKKRFKNEAAIIDQFDHPHIVKVIERGEADGNLYIAMELLEGRNLSEILKEEGGFSIAIAVDIMIQAADGLTKIHRKNIIHRDLKPENIMIIQKEDNPYFVKILDFGLSKTHSLSRLTQTGMILGTIFYLSPEQILDTGITIASDVYALGIIYYEMLSGQKPFAGETEESVIKQILEKEPLEIKQLRPDVPAELSGLIEKMAAKKPLQRPSIEQVLETLRKIV